nr:hypothetical protein [Tanacetum cinerariifolium]
MTAPNVTSSTDSQMHNNIMASGSMDRPPMLATGRYPQWRSRFLRYINTRPNGEALRKCILSGPYKLTTVLVQAVEATDDSPAVPEHTTVKTPMNMSLENKAHFEAEKEAIYMILTGIGDEIYSTPEWSRFVTIVKQQHKLDEVSYHKLFDILKQYHNEVNELRVERLARNTNPLALVATTQASQDLYYQTSRHKGKEIAKPITPPFETASEEDIDPKQAQRDKDMQKNLALIAKYFKKIYKPSNNNLRTSSNSKNKNVDTTPWFKNDNQSGKFRNQRTINVAAARENVESQDSAYHKEKMLLCKQAEQGVLLQAKQYDWLEDTDEEVDEQELEAHYSYMAKIQEVPNADLGTDSEPVEQDDECVALANLKLDVDENKKIQKQLKKANTTLAQELKECKTILAKTSKSLGESISVQDSYLDALQTKQAEFEKYKAFNDHTIDYDKLERRLNETLGQLAQKDIEIKEGLKTKAYELSVVKEKHDELMKQSLLTKSHYEGLVKQKTKVITDLKLREEHDIEKMLSMEKQLKFLNEIVYKRSQSIQTIHMMAPKVSTYNGRPTFANPRYLKQAQSEIPCLYAFPYDQNTHANRFIPDGEETLALERASRSKLNKDSVRPYDYTKLNSLYEIFKAPTQEYEIQLAHDQEKNVAKIFSAQDIEILTQTCLMPPSTKTQNDSFRFVYELKQEMHADLKYVESLAKEIDVLESDTAEFSDMYDVILQECVSKDVMCSYLQSLSDLDALDELKCLYLHKVKECDCLAQKFSNQTKSVSKKTKSIPKDNVSEGLSKPVTAQTLPQTAKQAVSNTNVLKPGMYRINNRTTYTRAPQLPQTVKNTNPRMYISTGVNHKPTVSRPQLRSNQSRDKVLPNNSQVKAKKTQVEVHPRIPSVSNKMKSVTTCKDSLNSRTLNANVVCVTCNKCLVDSNHFYRFHDHSIVTLIMICRIKMQDIKRLY